MGKKQSRMTAEKEGAWNRIQELTEAIHRQAIQPDGSPTLCESWAREIVMQCGIIREKSQQNQGR